MILPGVGAFDSGIEKIKKNNLINSIENKVLDKSTPILGICLGMQMMLESSEEGKKKGLGWIKGKVTKFTDHNLKIPHMGWNQVRKTKNNKLTNNLLSDSRFYFVHSYFANLKDKKNQILQTAKMVFSLTKSQAIEKESTHSQISLRHLFHLYLMTIYNLFLRS